jgi:uncharacterized protein (UPF0371 family)
MTKSALEKVSGEVIAEMKGLSFDPAMLLIIAEIIMSLLKNCQAKRDREAIGESLRKPGFLEKLALRRATREHLGNQNFRSYGNEVMAALTTRAAKSTQEEVDEVLNDIL